MLKQAIALLVHQNPDQVNTLIKLLEKDFDIYIHIDKKSTIDPSQLNCTNTWKNFTVKWGGYSMVQATVFLYKKIIEQEKPYSHIILLSGDSLPVKSPAYISEFLSANEGVSFLESNIAEGLKLERRTLLWFNEDIKNKSALSYLFRFIRLLQRKLNIKRSTIGFERIGSQWTILSVKHLEHLLKNGRINEYWSIAVPDESFVQNHFSRYNIPYCGNKIYAHWPEMKSASPGYIDLTTFQELLKSDYLFARKFKADTCDVYEFLNTQEADNERASSR